MSTGGGAGLTWSGEAKPTNEGDSYGGSDVTLREGPASFQSGDHRWALVVVTSPSGTGVGADLRRLLDVGKSAELESGARPMSPVRSQCWRFTFSAAALGRGRV
jgi:hypothetical protein